MATEEPDVQVNYSDAYREIQVGGQLINTAYEGMRLTVINDRPNIKDMIKGSTVRPSKMTIDRTIECTLILPPSGVKAWAIALRKAVMDHERTFGPIFSPEEVEQKLRDANSSNKDDRYE